MQKYIAILRGINVSGKNKIKMVALRNTLSAAGFAKVQSYIQSGNLVFVHEGLDPFLLAEKIRQIVLQAFDIDAPVVAKDFDDYYKIYHSNPFLKQPEIDFSKLHISFLANRPSRELMSNIKDFIDPPNKLLPGTDVIYIHTPNGYSKSKFTNNFLESKLKVTASTRNLKTTQKLLEMAGQND